MERTAAILSASVVLAAGLLTLSQVEAGRLSMQMVLHLAAMNVAAPMAATVLPAWPARRSFLWTAALTQILLLWAWHAPASQQAAAAAPLLHVAMLVSLSLVALLFWYAVLSSASERRWSAVMALLLTGKLACLLGALLIFAPSDLYRLGSLDDQQLAGLLMVTACPLSYLVAGVVLAAQALAHPERVEAR
ncbi:MAG: cytochrome C oxidase assembly protein [Alphaproteobacteria bacterium]|nr:cytochrome C oxidase assembly protein [Alphaproteobacteria bacterium]